MRRRPPPSRPARSGRADPPPRRPPRRDSRGCIAWRARIPARAAHRKRAPPPCVPEPVSNPFRPLFPPIVAGSPARKARLTLFIEGAHTFAPVLGRDHPVVGLDLEHHAAREIHLHPKMNRVLGL